jgi:hypothetical protein
MMEALRAKMAAGAAAGLGTAERAGRRWRDRNLVQLLKVSPV